MNQLAGLLDDIVDFYCWVRDHDFWVRNLYASGMYVQADFKRMIPHSSGTMARHCWRATGRDATPQELPSYNIGGSGRIVIRARRIEHGKLMQAERGGRDTFAIETRNQSARRGNWQPWMEIQYTVRK